MIQHMTNLASGNISEVVRKALRSGQIGPEDSALLFYDLDFLKRRLEHLKSCFPFGSLHGLAIKACPLAGIMKITRELGFGVEAASIGEVKMALHMGFDPSMIVYDSPAKTMEELRFALSQGILLNLDNFSELERVRIILSQAPSKSRIGIRVNPQVGEGLIAESSVAGIYSKFGVPVGSSRSELIDAFLNNDFLTGLHLHVGSQGCSLDLLVNGCGTLYDLMLEINAATTSAKGFNQITTFDIGGGLPVSYFRDNPVVSMEEYVAALKIRCPLLFPDPSSSDRVKASGIHLITEFGRWTYTNAGWTLSRVEYVKHHPGINTAMIHVGADLFVRECLNPKDWSHEYSILDAEGFERSGTTPEPWNLAGPLCFSGDILAKNVSLPEVREGDFLVIHDTGSYTFSMWSRYNSRFAPRILGYRRDGEEFVILRERETIEDIIKFWS